MTKEVLEFIIVPPYEDREKVAEAKDRLEDYLSRKFPGYKFRVSGFVPIGDDEDFAIVPIMNYLGEDGKAYMCSQPKAWFMTDILRACRDFHEGRAVSFAA